MSVKINVTSDDIMRKIAELEIQFHDMKEKEEEEAILEVQTTLDNEVRLIEQEEEALKKEKTEIYNRFSFKELKTAIRGIKANIVEIKERLRNIDFTLQNDSLQKSTEINSLERGDFLISGEPTLGQQAIARDILETEELLKELEGNDQKLRDEMDLEINFFAEVPGIDMKNPTFKDTADSYMSRIEQNRVEIKYNTEKVRELKTKTTELDTENLMFDRTAFSLNADKINEKYNLKNIESENNQSLAKKELLVEERNLEQLTGFQTAKRRASSPLGVAKQNILGVMTKGRDFMFGNMIDKGKSMSSFIAGAGKKIFTFGGEKLLEAKVIVVKKAKEMAPFKRTGKFLKKNVVDKLLLKILLMASKALESIEGLEDALKDVLGHRDMDEDILDQQDMAEYIETGLGGFVNYGRKVG